ncbi:MAG: VWA domain-containing protein [Pyrinomonadaceae bacterium]|nr:VWA domain-containing protein [Pyrinomonadaceae bacterium]
MKKIVPALILLSLCSVLTFSQSTKVQRPRVVVDPTPTPTPSDTKKPLAPPPSLIIESDEEIKIETELVTLPVSVLDREGRFISGLRELDFDIYENGAKQQIEYFASLEKPFTVVLLIDVSPSTKYKIDEIQDAAISFVSELRPQDRVVVASFSRDFTILSKNKRSYHRIRRDIRKAQFGDGTSLYQAIDYAVENLLRPIEGRKALVLFSDGVDTTSIGPNFRSTLAQVEAADSLVYAVRYNTFDKSQVNPRPGYVYPVGSSPQEYARGKDYLKKMTRLSGGRLFEAENTRNLDAAFTSIAEELRRQYAIGYYPEIVGQAGERKNIRVLVKKPNLTVRTKNSYIVKKDEN